MEKGKLYKEILMRSPVAYGYQRILTDSEGNPCDYIFMEANPAFEKMIGFKEKDIIGKKLTKILDNTQKDVFNWIQTCGKIALEKEYSEFIRYAKELGGWYKIVVFSPEEKHFAIMFYEIWNKIKMMKQVEKKEKITKTIFKKYEMLFKNSPDAIAYVDKNHIVKNVNKTFLNLFQYTREECIGKNLDDIVIKKDLRSEAEKNTFNLFKTGKIDLEAVRYTKYGQPIHVKIRGVLVKEKDEILGGHVIYTDITERVRYQKKLESTNEELEATIGELTASEEELKAQYDEMQNYLEKNEELRQKYEIAIKATDSFVWELDKEYEFTHHISQKAEEIVGEKIQVQKLHEMINKIVYPEDRKILIEAFEKHQQGIAKEINTQIRIKDKAGRIRWYLVKGKEIKDRQGNIKSVNGVFIEVTEMKEKEAYIQYLADHDPLTGIPNRRKFTELFTEELLRGKKGAMLLLDLDNFKNINDTVGHIYGDKLLKEVSAILQKFECEDIHVFRIGGDEFIILMKENIKTAEDYARKILKNFQEKISIDGIETPITASIGIVRYPDDGQDMNDLLKKADIAMYKAKYTGKNKYLLFSKQMEIQFNEKIKIENILRKAVKEEGFTLYYQPIIETNTGEISSFEALIRLKEIDISPGIFIPIAEETDVIIPIGRWVIKEVIKQIKIWKEKGFDLKPIAINVSPRQFSDSRFIEYLKNSLEENDIHPSLIEIEITENVLIENQEETIQKLKQLKRLGIAVVLDDFGTGYSSLNYLTYIAVDKIKLDKSLKDKFIKLENIQILDSLICIAHGLNIKVVAEGVEELEEYKRLKKGKCDYLQGYLFSKPVKGEDLDKFLNDNYLKLFDRH
ncbi:EAL domain-containing protein [Thermotalea metallivorans]|uniref:Cyclic di-GMP phosphodiesterase Gmr n=1 Tax=Thermotalea metallivorans TaxID=520762 RepID=A0A140L4Q3_9FIRM|nr:EAL domain-containing protein [Thermotalea metallivorans]KXG75528.1 Cyclic di-GMP phosphodiesterase Gmr [Thermotalea metallivorans]